MKKWLSTELLLSASLMVIVIGLLMPGASGFVYPPRPGSFSDQSVSHFPNAIHFQRSVMSYAEFPLWSPLILSGYPFSANPLSGVWYPINWILLFLPLPFGLNLLIAAHIIWGAWGMKAYLRQFGVAVYPAILGMASFLLLPKIYAHHGAGHYSLLCAISWTPWLLRGSLMGSLASMSWMRRMLCAPGFILGVILLIDPRWGMYAGATWIAHELFVGFVGDNEKTAFIGEAIRDREESSNYTHHIKISLDAAFIVAKKLLIQSGIALCLACPLLLPMLEYAGLSTRSSMSLQDTLNYSFPPERLLGFVFPDFGGFHEWLVYPGAVILVFASIQAISGLKERRVIFWMMIVLASLIYALGPAAWIGPLLNQLPVVNLLRVPSRALFVTLLGIITLSSLGMQRWLQGFPQAQEKGIRLACVMLAGFIVFISIGIQWISGKFLLSFTWGGLAGLLSSIIAFGLVGADHTRVQRWIPYLILLSIIDLGGVDRTLFQYRPSSTILSEGVEFADILDDSRTFTFRVYSPSYSLPQQTAALHGWQLADGVDPLQLESYSRYMEEASGVPNLTYSVTLPPFETGDLASDNELAIPDARHLGWLNVRYMVSAFPVAASGLDLIKQQDEMYLYLNHFARPRAWVQPEAGFWTGDVMQADIEAWSPNRVTLSAEGPGWLVLSEINYPGWVAIVQGTPRSVETVYGILRGLPLEAGRQEIIFLYQPRMQYLGLLLGLASLVWLILWSYCTFQGGKW
jgi:hypothetical protein